PATHLLTRRPTLLQIHLPIHRCHQPTHLPIRLPIHQPTHLPIPRQTHPRTHLRTPRLIPRCLLPTRQRTLLPTHQRTHLPTHQCRLQTRPLTPRQIHRP